MTKSTINYPQKGDKFFKDTGSPNEMAWLHGTFQAFGAYAYAYQRSAITLIDTALADQCLKDYHVYPAIFLIRHYLELRLKELIQGINFCNEHGDQFPTHHDILNLWGEFKKAYKTIGQNATDARFQAIDELIKEMRAVDPDSSVFRYPVDKDGKQNKQLTYVNLLNLKETFIKVCTVLDAVADQIGEFTDNAREQLASVYGANW